MKDETKKLLLVGGGGHCRVVLDSLLEISDYDEIGIIDKNNEVQNNDSKGLVFNTPIIGTDKELVELYEKGYKYAFITVGSIGDITVRKRLYELICEIGFEIPNIIDKSSTVCSHVALGKGIYIGKNAIVNTNVQIGDFAIINTGSIVEHDCSVGDFVHIATGSILCGNVKINSGTHIGAGSIVRQGIEIGKDAMIGMGSIVLSHFGDSVKAYGIPCKEVTE